MAQESVIVHLGSVLRNSPCVCLCSPTFRWTATPRILVTKAEYGRVSRTQLQVALFALKSGHYISTALRFCSCSMSVVSPEEYMMFGFFWKLLPNIFPHSVLCLARQRIHIVRQLLGASGSCRQTCSQQSDVRSFQLNMVSVPVSMRTRCRRWSAGSAPRLHEDPLSAMERECSSPSP